MDISGAKNESGEWVPPSIEDRTRTNEVLAATVPAMVSLLLQDDPRDLEEELSIGTGLVVHVGGRAFVFTVGHNVGKNAKQRCRIALQFYRRNLLLTALMDQKFIDVKWLWSDDGLPDVGVIELDPEYKNYWRNAPVLGVKNLALPNEVDPSAMLMFIGYPAAKTTKPTRFDPSITNHLAIGTQGIAVQVDRIVRIDDDGLLYIPYEIGKVCPARFESKSGEQAEALPAPGGISGGPLLTVNLETNHIQLLGLARDHGRNHQRFEPVYRVLRLLIDHPAPEVASEARETYERMEAGLQQLLKNGGA